MKKIFKVITLLSLTNILAIGCHSTPEERAEKVVKQLSRKLNLNKEQKAKLYALRDAVKDVRERRKSDKTDLFNEAKGLVTSEKIQASELRDLMLKKEKIMTEEEPNIFPKLQDFHASLNSEQKQKVADFMTKIYEKRNGLD